MSSKKILLVEDETFILDLYKYTLSGQGFEIITAIDGFAALEILNKSIKEQLKFDLVLLDVMLPKMNGIEVLKLIKSEPSFKYLPVVLITNLGNREIIKQAFKIGASGYILKANVTPYEIGNKIKPFLSDPTFKMDVSSLDFD